MKLSFPWCRSRRHRPCHLVECAGKRMLIDWAVPRGAARSTRRTPGRSASIRPGNRFRPPHPRPSRSCGRLALLSKRGFRGEIITTATSRELARLVMLDAAHLEEEDVRRRRRPAMRHGKEPRSSGTALLHARRLDRLRPSGARSPTPRRSTSRAGIHATFIDAGHILGSSCVLLELSEGDKRQPSSSRRSRQSRAAAPQSAGVPAARPIWS